MKGITITYGGGATTFMINHKFMVDHGGQFVMNNKKRRKSSLHQR